MAVQKAVQQTQSARIQTKPAKPTQLAASPTALGRLTRMPSGGQTAADVLSLQSTVGNRAVQRLLTRPHVQAKLSVGPASDKFEQEADRLANEVTRSAPTPHPTVRRQALGEEDETLQTKRLTSGDGFDLDNQVEGRLHQAKTGGQPLPTNTRSTMESRFGADFGSVKVHTDASAVQLNRDIQAQAFTHGSDIFFGESKYNPGTSGGQHLLAHELTHVVQQGQAGPGANVSQRQVEPTLARTEPNHIQRFSVDPPPIPWNTATMVTPSSSGAVGVFFVKDGTNSPVIVKANQDTVDVTHFAGNLHGKIGAGRAPVTRGATAEERAGFTELLDDNTKADQAAWKKNAENLGPNVTPEEARENKIDTFKRMPVMYVMGMAQGKDFADIAKGEDPHNNVQNLLLNAEYMTKLGIITAIDAFLGNEDRLLTGNVGNWITGSGFDRDISVIDNVDTMTRHAFGGRERTVEGNDPIRKLAPSRLQQTAELCVRMLFRGLAEDAPDTDLTDLSENNFFKNRMARQLLDGLRDGRKRLLHKLTPGLFRKRSRTLKQGVMEGPGNDQQGLWELIKNRASFLKKLK